MGVYFQTHVQNIYVYRIYFSVSGSSKIYKLQGKTMYSELLKMALQEKGGHIHSDQQTYEQF